MKLGSLKFDTTEFASRANAVIGTRDSGKSYTATGFAEQLLDSTALKGAGIPFVAFDPAGIWRFLRVKGAGKGYPVVVVGGPAADLPLKSATIGKIVEAALKGAVSLVIDLSGEISKAEMRGIVTVCVSVLMAKNSQYGMRHVFLEEAAEFVPQKVRDGIVYAAIEKLVRVGGNMGLGVTLINPRTQNLNKEVLELCDNIFLHRQRGKRSLENLHGWFDAVGVDEPKGLSQEVSKLKSGECFAWLRDADEPVHVKVQQKNSFHPNRRDLQAATGKAAKRIDAALFVDGLKAALPQVEAEMAATDPKLLNAEIARLKGELAKKPAAAPAVDPKPIKEAAFNAGVEAGQRQGARQLKAMHGKMMKEVLGMKRKISAILAAMARDAKAVEDGLERLKAAAATIEGATALDFTDLTTELEKLATAVGAGVGTAVSLPTATPSAKAPIRKPELKPVDGGEYSIQERKILKAMSELEHMNNRTPSRAQVAIMANYHINTGKFQGAITSLKARGLLRMGDDGSNLVMAAENPLAVEAPFTVDEIKKKILAIMSDEAQRRTFEALYGVDETGVTRQELADLAGYHINTGKHQGAVTKMRKLAMIVDKPGNRFRLDEWVYGR